MTIGIKQLVYAGVLLGVPVSSYFLVFKPQNEAIARAKSEIDLKQSMLTKLREATRTTDDLKRANAEIAQSVKGLEARLPSDKEIDAILRDVAQIAAASGLKLPVFKKNDKPQQAGLAMEQPLEMELTGDFDGLYLFLLKLEQLPRITRLTDLKIERPAKDAEDGEVKATCTLSIFYQDAAASAGGSVAGATGRESGGGR